MAMGSNSLGQAEVTCVLLPESKSYLNTCKEGNWTDVGLRCRFRFTKGNVLEFPAILHENVSAASCVCTSEVTNTAEQTRVSLVMDGCSEMECEPLQRGTDEVKLRGEARDASSSLDVGAGIIKRLSWIDRYLAVWIFVTMVAGVLVGNFAPKIKDAWEVVKVDTVSLPIAIGLWWMMLPILCKVRYELMWKALQSRLLLRHIALSLVFNWFVGPLLMTGLAWATLPDLAGYRNGIILVGIARCIAMVLIWNHLAGGNTEFCAILVAVNSVLQIALYSPLALFYLKVVSNSEDLNVGFWTVAKSVLLFLGVPLAAAVLIRSCLRKLKGPRWYDQSFLPWFGPTALLGLLFTIFVMFSLQGKDIVHSIPEVVRVAVPLLLYFGITFSSSMFVCWWLRIPYPDTVTQCFTASSNNFELAIAVAVGSFGIGSQEALAAVVGPLIEVPVLIGLVYVSIWLEKKVKWASTELVMGNSSNSDAVEATEEDKPNKS